MHHLQFFFIFAFFAPYDFFFITPGKLPVQWCTLHSVVSFPASNLRDSLVFTVYRGRVAAVNGVL